MRFSWTYKHILFNITLPFLLSCGQSDSKPSTRDTSENSSAASIKTGVHIFNQNCKICHGADGKMGLNGAKDLSISQLPIEERVKIITNGKNLMTPFGTILSRSEIDSVAAFTFQLRQNERR